MYDLVQVLYEYYEAYVNCNDNSSPEFAEARDKWVDTIINDYLKEEGYID